VIAVLAILLLAVSLFMRASARPWIQLGIPLVIVASMFLRDERPRMLACGVIVAIALAYAASVAITLREAMVVTIAGVSLMRWLPLSDLMFWREMVVLGGVLMILWSADILVGPAGRNAGAPLVLACLIALAALFVRIASGEAGTVDYVYFWGVKAVRFAFNHGIDTEWLRSPFNLHAHPNYPPLVPVNVAWSITVANAMPWMQAPLVGCLWIAAAAPVLYNLLRERMTQQHAMLVVVLWTAAICQSLVASYSAGGAEMQLVAAMTIACAALIVRGAPLIVIIGVAAALLTKLEATFESIALMAGALIVMKAWRRVAAMTAIAFVPLAAWWLLERMKGIPLSDPIREKAGEISLASIGIVPGLMLKHMESGSYWVAWILATVAILSGWRRMRSVAPALTLIAAIFGFAFIYYLHVTIDPRLMVQWTFPRLSQPALSAAIIAAGYVTWGLDDDERGVRVNGDRAAEEQHVDGDALA
jgi:hypothetical protein